MIITYQWSIQQIVVFILFIFVDYRFHFVGLVSSIEVSTMEVTLSSASVRCFMGSSHYHRYDNIMWHG